MRRDEPNAVWHVTGRVNWRVWHLEPDRAFSVFVRQLQEAQELYEKMGATGHVDRLERLLRA